MCKPFPKASKKPIDAQCYISPLWFKVIKKPIYDVYRKITGYKKIAFMHTSDEWVRSSKDVKFIERVIESQKVTWS